MSYILFEDMKSKNNYEKVAYFLFKENPKLMLYT